MRIGPRRSDDGLWALNRAGFADEAISDMWRAGNAAFRPFEATRAANQAVYDRMAGNPALRGMGATIVGAVLEGWKVSWFNIGDSRGYLFRNSALTQFTVDHVPRGATASRKIDHSITQSIGGGYQFIDVWPAVGEFVSLDGDTLLLCSDGLTDVVSEQTISSILRSSKSPFEAAQAMITAVKNQGAPDNVSLVIAHLSDPRLQIQRPPT